MLDKGSEYIVDIVDLGENGVGVGKYDGLTVFVDNATIHDKVKVKITKTKKNYAVGDLVEVIEPSALRVKPCCDAFDKMCGGCQVQQLDYNEQLKIKTNTVKEAIKRIGKLEDINIKDTIGMENPFAYRNKAQFPVTSEGGKAQLGFFKKKSHDIVSTQDCKIQHDINTKIMDTVKKYVDGVGVTIYDEKIHKGLLRHVVTKVGFATDEVMVVMVVNGKNLPMVDELVNMLKSNVPGFKTLVVNINKDKTNVILGRHNKVIYGDGKIVDCIGDLKFEISPLSFFQVNPVQTKVLYDKALEFASLTGNENVFDIYCGIGSISLFLAQKAKHVYGVEIVEDAIKDAVVNAELNDIQNVEFCVGKAEEVLPALYEEGNKADVVVVDPPRKGCDERVLETIVEISPKRVVYVSCNPSTLARDLAYLAEHGYQCECIQPVDMFPHTMHVECVARIVKKL